MDRLRMIRAVRCDVSCLVFVGAVASAGCAADSLSGLRVETSSTESSNKSAVTAGSLSVAECSDAIAMWDPNGIYPPNTCLTPPPPYLPDDPLVPPEMQGDDPTPPGLPGRCQPVWREGWWVVQC